MNDNVVSAPEADTPQTGIAEYSATERGLAELRQRLAGRVYQVATTKGMKEACADRAELRSLRVNLDKLRKQLNEDDQARIRKRNDKAKEITAQIEALEDPIDAQIKAEEERKEQEKQERARAEAERLRRINEELGNIQRLPLDCLNATADELQAAIEALTADTLEDFDEIHLPSAQAAKDASLSKLREMLDARITADAEAERLAAERAELERLRAEQDRVIAEQAEERRRQDEAAEHARRAAALMDEHIADLRGIPAALVGKSSDILRGAIDEVESIDPNHPRFGDRRVDADAARVATLSRLREMLDVTIEQERVAAEQAERQRQLDAQAETQRIAQEEAEARARAEREEREAAERAERERLEAEAAERHRQQEEDAIQRATLREAAQEAHAVLCELGHANHITTRKLASALAKEPQA